MSTDFGQKSWIGYGTRRRSSQDECIGMGAQTQILGLFHQRTFGERGRVLDAQVGQQANIDAEFAATAQDLGGASLNDPLIGQHGTREDVDPHEGRFESRGDAEGGQSVVAQDIDPQRQIWPGMAQGGADARHGGDGLGRHPVLVEGNVAVVLEHQRPDAAEAQGFGIVEGRVFDGLDVAIPIRRTGQGAQMNHADNGGCEQAPPCRLCPHAGHGNTQAPPPQVDSGFLVGCSSTVAYIPFVNGLGPFRDGSHQENDMQVIQGRSGWLEVICGPMFSGKSEELIRRIRRAEIARQRIQLFKPKVDDRYSETEIVSHSQQRLPSTPVASSLDILACVDDKTEVVGIDEVQFFDEGIVEVCDRLANMGKRVMAAGLDMDYLGRPFAPMPNLMAIAEYVTKQLAICMRCGDPAVHTQRLTDSTDTIVVGAQGTYEARCRRCFVLPDVSQEEPKDVAKG